MNALWIIAWCVFGCLCVVDILLELQHEERLSDQVDAFCRAKGFERAATNSGWEGWKCGIVSSLGSTVMCHDIKRFDTDGGFYFEQSYGCFNVTEVVE